MLSKSNRNSFLIAMAAQEHVTRWVESENCNIAPEEKRLLKTGRSFLKKGMKQMIERLLAEDPEATKQLMGDARRHSLVLEPKRTALTERVTVDLESFSLLTDIVVSDCQERPEEWCQKSHKTCVLRKALIACQVQYKNTEKGCKTCRYREV